MALLAGLLTGGCHTPPLTEARSQFASGEWRGAEQQLAQLPENDKDRVLFLMERGMIRHSLQKYDDSSRDWLEAVQLEKDLETHSASKAAASMVINDRTLAFRGAPYEQTLLHTFLAKNFLAQGRWDDAAVEGRNIARRQENRGAFPDDAYSRYVAGLTFELSGDTDNAHVQYRLAGQSNRFVRVDPATGGVAPANTTAAPAPSGGFELVCLLNFGHIRSRSTSGATGDTNATAAAPYAEIYAQGKYLGRGYVLTSTEALARHTRQVLALRKNTKTASRIALKLALADGISRNNESLGALVRLALLASEQPDDRHWATLPRWMGVARVPCPAQLTAYEVVFFTPGGQPLRRIKVERPLTRRGKTWVSICRDGEGFSASPPAESTPGRL